MTVLAIETSCDDTSVAIVRDRTVLSNLISSQPIHDTWGGIVPELASREHVKAIGPLLHAALHQANVTIDAVDAVAVTTGPGLAGSLLVGSHVGKGLALRYGLPLLPVHHIEAHIYSGYLEGEDLPFPSVCLVVSGGHTSIVLVRSYSDYEVLGNTRDDAAGEAFDKVSKLLGMGYPGGPHIDRLAQRGNPDAYVFPRGLAGDGSYDFSFSGLKTAVRYHVRDAERDTGPLTDDDRANICASVQRAIVDVLVTKTMRAASEHHVRAVCVAGGVSANSELRATFAAACAEKGLLFAAPRAEYCVDNAAMIGFLASQRFALGDRGDLHCTIQPRGLRS